LLFCAETWPRRLALVASAGLAIAGTLLLYRVLAPHSFAQWLDILTQVGIKLVRGHGFLAVAGLLGVRAKLSLCAAYLVYAALLGAAALLLAQRLAGRERMALGVLVCLLLYPRLMDYDFFTAPFGLAVLARFFTSLAWFRAALSALCLAAALLGGQMGGEMAYLLAVALVFAALLTAWPETVRSAVADPAAATPATR
jgi:hypothetical protein